MIFIQPYQMRHLLKRRTVALHLPARHGYRVGHIDYADTADKQSTTRICITKVAGTTVHIQAVREELPRFLAANPAAQRADYVTDPSRAMFGEPAAVTGPALTRIVTQAHARYRAEHGQKILDRRARSIAIRLKEAARRGDSQAYLDLSRELNQITEHIAGSAVA